MGPKPKHGKNQTILDFFGKKKQVGQSSQPPAPVAQPTVRLGTSPACTTPVTQSQQGSSAPTPCQPLDKKGEEPHPTHSFKWCLNNKKPTILTCNRAGTVESLLKRSPKFNKIAEKNKNKELVIVRDGKAISSHFPCCLIKKKCLTIKYIKAVDKVNESAKNQGFVVPRFKGPSGKFVTFNVLTTGGKRVTKIMRNPALKEDFVEITVYACKGEKVKHALKRDGRLLNTVFKKNCVLSHTSTAVTTEMSNLVDDLDGATFKITLVNKSSPPNSQSGSLDDAYMMPSACDADGTQDPPQQSTTTESVNHNTSVETPTLSTSTEPEIIACEIPNSNEMRTHLSSKFKNLVMQRMKTQKVPQLSKTQNLFRVEFGKNAQTCREVRTMKKLMELSNSVCQVRINGRPEGSGFLLFGEFVLTNGHVIKNIYNMNTGQLHERVTVHFSFESLDQMESGAVVEEVAGFEFWSNASGMVAFDQALDWALLRISAHLTLPNGLLEHFGFLPPSGGICIIGHPEGGVKRIDPCLITPSPERQQVVEEHCHKNPEGVLVEDNQGSIQLLTQNFFDDAKYFELNRQVLTYQSCFYHGSSGSPVFDEHCNVVAMHTAGYVYYTIKGSKQNVIELGYPLSTIIEHIIVQLVERKKFDVLQKYLACSYTQHQNMMTGLKTLVDSRNLAAFKNADNNPVATSESLKRFFEFFSQQEEPESMETD